MTIKFSSRIELLTQIEMLSALAEHDLICSAKKKKEKRKRGMIYIINAIDILSLKLDSCPLLSKL